MEENTTIPSNFESFSKLDISTQAISFLKETAKWAQFLAIVGFIFIGLMVIAAFSMGAIFSSIPMVGSSMGDNMLSGFGWMVTVIYLIFAVIYFMPVYYLFKFSSNMKVAIQNNDTVVMTESFNYLKKHYRFIGILTIIFLSLYLFFILIGVLGAINN